MYIQDAASKMMPNRRVFFFFRIYFLVCQRIFFFENRDKYALLYNCCIMVGFLGCFGGVCLEGGLCLFLLFLVGFCLIFLRFGFVLIAELGFFSHKELLKSFQNIFFQKKEKQTYPL